MGAGRQAGRQGANVRERRRGKAGRKGASVRERGGGRQGGQANASHIQFAVNFNTPFECWVGQYNYLLAGGQEGEGGSG